MRIRQVIVLLAGVSCARQDPSVALPNIGDVARSDTTFTWDSIPGRGFTLYVTRGGYAAARAEDYRKQVDSSIANALRMLGEASYAPHMRVFLVSSREDVERITGTGSNGWADAASNSMVLVRREGCPYGIKHEVMHLVSLRKWGHPLGRDGDPTPPPLAGGDFARGGWMREGLASLAEDEYSGFSYRGLAAQWQVEAKLLPLDSLVNGFYTQDDLAAYIQASSFVQFLIESYGVGRFHEVWRVGAAAGFDRVYHRTAAQLEADWQRWLKLTPASARPASIAEARAADHCPPRVNR